nr:MAG TPA: hypothetical protein [Caudoviricetes sp.]
MPKKKTVAIQKKPTNSVIYVLMFPIHVIKV